LRHFWIWDEANGKPRACTADDALVHLMWILAHDPSLSMVGATPSHIAWRQARRVQHPGCTHGYAHTLQQLVLVRLLPTLSVSYLCEALTPALETRLAALTEVDRANPLTRHYFQGEDYSMAEQLCHPTMPRKPALAFWLSMTDATASRSLAGTTK
jgi:hypothetical protein